MESFIQIADTITANFLKFSYRVRPKYDTFIRTLNLHLVIFKSSFIRGFDDLLDPADENGKCNIRT